VGISWQVGCRQRGFRLGLFGLAGVNAGRNGLFAVAQPVAYCLSSRYRSPSLSKKKEIQKPIPLFQKKESPFLTSISLLEFGTMFCQIEKPFTYRIKFRDKKRIKFQIFERKTVKFQRFCVS
jgi:hypothetical protein